MNNRLRQKWLGIALTMAITCPIVTSAKDKAVLIEDARHLKVFYEVGRFFNNIPWKAAKGKYS